MDNKTRRNNNKKKDRNTQQKEGKHKKERIITNIMNKTYEKRRKQHKEKE